MGFVRGRFRARPRMAAGAINGLELRFVRKVLNGLEVGVTAEASDRLAMSGGTKSAFVDEDDAAAGPTEVFVGVALQTVGVLDLDEGSGRDQTCGQTDG